ncbi:MAG: YbaK/EbsC family protein [Patescibacteria group bacterium]|jgi:prolyl-tRNA editing enzyme YbaK/EbsC (Cys-tRNA(Pro) deacylase)
MSVKKRKLPVKTIKYLEKAGIKHDLLEHKTIYTAIDAANTMKKKMEEIAKSLLVKADKDYYMVLLPADQNLDMEKLKKVLSKAQQKQIKLIKIPGEKLAREVLKVKNDSIAAFGSLYKLPVIIDKKIANIKTAVFSSDSFNHSVEMAVKDFISLENALIDTFGIKKKIKKQASVKKKVNKKKKTSKKSIKKKPTKKRVIKR